MHFDSRSSMPCWIAPPYLFTLTASLAFAPTTMSDTCATIYARPATRTTAGDHLSPLLAQLRLGQVHKRTRDFRAHPSPLAPSIDTSLDTNASEEMRERGIFDYSSTLAGGDRSTCCSPKAFTSYTFEFIGGSHDDNIMMRSENVSPLQPVRLD